MNSPKIIVTISPEIRRHSVLWPEIYRILRPSHFTDLAGRCWAIPSEDNFTMAKHMFDGRSYYGVEFIKSHTGELIIQKREGATLPDKL